MYIFLVILYKMFSGFELLGLTESKVKALEALESNQKIICLIASNHVLSLQIKSNYRH